MTTELSPEDVAAGWTADEWTYIGRRFSAGDKKLWLHFIDHRGTRRLFSKGPTGPVIGGLYLVESRHINTDGEDRITARIQDARYVGSVDPAAATLDDWRLADRAASAQLEAIRTQKRAAADNGDFGSMSLADVRALVSRQATSAARAGMIAAVLNYIERGC